MFFAGDWRLRTKTECASFENAACALCDAVFVAETATCTDG